MVRSDPHQENPCQADPQRTEPVGSQRQGNFPGPEHEQLSLLLTQSCMVLKSKSTSMLQNWNLKGLDLVLA